MQKHIPNVLTILRFLLIPIIMILLVKDKYIAAAIVLTFSGITDILDGFIARKFNFITNFGKLMDPLADKCTQVSILIALALKGIIPFWILIIVFLKEFFMIAGASFLYGKELVVSSRWYGKLATVIFYSAICCSFIITYWNKYIFENSALDTAVNSISLPHFDLYIYYFALATAIFSLVMYFNDFYKQGYLKKEGLTIKK